MSAKYQDGVLRSKVRLASWLKKIIRDKSCTIIERDIELTSLISPTSRFLVSEPEPFASGGGPELVGVHGAEMVSAAATALPVTINHIRYFSAPDISHPRVRSF